MATRNRMTGQERVGVPMRDRAVLVNQALLGAFALVGVTVAIGFDIVVDANVLFLGITLIFLAAGAAFVVPWAKLSPVALLAIPAVDTVAIAMLRAGAPDAALGVLWLFPAIWVGSAFRGWGALIAVTSIGALNLALQFAYGIPVLAPNSFMLTAVVLGDALIASYSSRRARAQRMPAGKAIAAPPTLGRACPPAGGHRHGGTSGGRLRRYSADDGRIPRRHERCSPPLARVARRFATAVRCGRNIPTPSRSASACPGATRRGVRERADLVRRARRSAPRAFRSSARVLRDQHGEPVGMIIVTLDVTAEELALRAREDLVASVSHELRTPLTSITGYLDLALDDESLAPSTRKNLEVVERNASRLLHIAADLLTATSVGTVGVPLTIAPEEIDLAAIIRAGVIAAEPQARTRDIAIDDSNVEDGDGAARIRIGSGR